MADAPLSEAALKPVLREIHRFWFGELDAYDDLPKDKVGIWFSQSDETDRTIRDRFGGALRQAAAIDWDLAALSRDEQVGLVVLFDQFPRNIFRTSGEAFAYDAKARAISRALIATGKQRFYLIEQVFLFVPFEHSEEIADQDYAVFLVAEMAVTCPEGFKDYARNFLDFVFKHRQLIRRFGRFPHRNALLGGDLSGEELTFLAEHGRGY